MSNIESRSETSTPIAVAPLNDPSFEQLIARKAELLSNGKSLEDLSVEQITEFHSICMSLRLKARPAGKPKSDASVAAGNDAAGKPKRGRPARTVGALLEDYDLS